MRFVTLLCLALIPMLAGSAQALQQRGLYVFGHEVCTVQLCGHSHVYWVRGSQHIRDRLQSEHQRLTSQPYQEIYLEFSGELVSGAREGFAADYDGIMDVTEIHEISARVPENCRSESSKAVGKPNRRPTPRTFAFACDGDYQFVARIEGEKAWVFRPEGTVSLPRVPSGSGAKYGDGSVTFWTKGQEALLEHGRKTHRRCRNDPRRAVWEHAKLNGADFRAVGNEPAWNLEILQQSKIVLITDYGANSYEFELPEPAVDREARITRYETSQNRHELIIVLRGQPCRDTMSDETFETAVVVTLDGRELRGCGRALH